MYNYVSPWEMKGSNLTTDMDNWAVVKVNQCIYQWGL